MRTKSNVFHWVLYDFANSIVMIVFFLYFAQWIVIDRGVPDIYFNLTFTISAALLLLTAPLMGTMLDKYWRRITGLRYSTFATVLSYGLCAIFAVNGKNVPALIFFTLGLYSYLLSFTFYTPLINDISSHSKRGLVSGLGIMANYLGQFTGLAIALPFANGTIKLFNSTPRAETLLPSVIIFLILSLPTLIFFKEPKKAKKKISLLPEMKSLWMETKMLFSNHSVTLFLLAYFLFNDALLTAINNFPIFLQQVWNVSDTVKTYLLLTIVITCAIGGVFSGLIADKFGHKKTLVAILACWLVAMPLLGLVTNFKVFVALCVFMGLWYGSTWTVSRSLMSCLTTGGKHNLAFSYFGLAERASSLVGPVVWGLVVTGMISSGSFRYRIAMVVVTGFILLGLIALWRVKDERHKRIGLSLESSGERI